MVGKRRTRDPSERNRLARERDAALGRITRVRVWAIGGVTVLSLGFAGLARALKPGHEVHSATAATIDRSEPTSSTASELRRATHSSAPEPGLQGPQSSRGLQGPQSSPGLAGYDQAPARSAPPVVSGGS